MIRGRTPEPSPGEPGFAIYIHWPFCRSKCPYCDFNSHVRDTVDGERWVRAIESELDHYAGRTPGRTVTSIFFGGGTPSLMPPDAAGRAIARVAANWSLAADAEITLEANPGASEADLFRAFRDAGVNRLSIGVQALDDEALAFLGRTHSADEALAAVGRAAALFPRHSFDLIYNRPGQTVAAWEAELRRALDHAGDHLSVYQLTIEPGTAFFDAHRRGAWTLPDEATQAELYETTQAILSEAGMPAYEISNHAAPDGASRHNLTYWRYGDYVGVGPGAHGRLTVDGAKLATRQRRSPEAWLEDVERTGVGTDTQDPVPRADRGAEMLMVGLRLAEGVDRARFAAEAGAELTEFIAADRLSAILDEGYARLDDRALRLTPEGRQRMDAILTFLLS
ncbi:MAG: radical SAM family heme chaperone HemW [Bauldia litoralis]